MTTFLENKKALARLAVKELNVGKGQRLVIRCSVENADFARICAKEAYDFGCKEVLMSWNDDELSKMKFLYADDEIFDTFNEWDKIFFDQVSKEGAAFLAIHDSDPKALSGVDSNRVKRAMISSNIAKKEFVEREMRGDFPWCVIAIPSQAWAKSVFPDLENDEGIARLWDEIFKACRIDGINTIDNWDKHSKEIRSHVDKLNNYNFKKLHYKNSIGTNLEVELPEGHIWAGGKEVGTNGIEYSANIPTEECFTLPKRTGINGKIVSSKPLCHNGVIIDDFYFVVKEGKIIEAKAKENEETLLNAISIDEGASYFGEVALVPYHSPISMSGVLFLNTLFDENASCHFAFGAAYPTTIKNSEGKTEEELLEMGVNSSMTHVDFMVGTKDLEIIGETHDGKEVPIFINGDFAF